MSEPRRDARNPSDDLNYEAFRELAKNPALSKYERIGFPDAYRAEYEEAIFSDISSKLPCMNETGKTIVDIGAGSSGLPLLLSEAALRRHNTLVLIDSPEMLDHLPDSPNTTKVRGRFPDCHPAIAPQSVDAIICYSVLQYVFVDMNVFEFVDRALSLLASGGRFLIGDVPNVSMRKRFFASETGIRAHQRYTGTDEMPQVKFNMLESNAIDDAVVIAILSRARAAGFHGYVLPQAPALPFATRREDILIVRP